MCRFQSVVVAGSTAKGAGSSLESKLSEGHLGCIQVKGDVQGSELNTEGKDGWKMYDEWP